VSLFYQLLDHQRLKNLKYNQSENSIKASFFPYTSTSTQSQSPSTAQTATSPIQGETLSSNLDQLVTEDDLLGILDSIPFQDSDSNLVNHRGQNLAHLCAQLRYHRLLTAVIERGTDIHAKDANGWTPLDFARLHRDEDATDILRGDWEEDIQDPISTGSLSTDPLPAFDYFDPVQHPTPVEVVARVPFHWNSVIGDEFYLLIPPTPVEVVTARNLGIQRYPSDILALIFRHWRDIWLTHLVHGIKRGTIHHGLDAPFVLQAVCRRWRDIARRDPKLWADLFISCGARNRRLNQRLDIIIERARNISLAVYIQNFHAAISGRIWFEDMRRILNPTVIRWTSLTMSFINADDVHALLKVWPLQCYRLQQIAFYGSVDGTPTDPLPFTFTPPVAPIRIIHLRNIGWWQSRTFVGLREIAIGPSDAHLLTQDVIVSVLAATPNIQRLKLLAFERADIPRPTDGLLKGFRLLHLQSLAASPVVLRTTLVGFDSPDMLPALANVSIHFDAQDKEETVEDNDNARREQDLRGVGVFLQRHSTTALKLRGLDEGYSPELVTSWVFVPMNGSRVQTMHFADCVGHTTDFIVQALKKVPYGVPGIPPNRSRGHTTLQSRGVLTEGNVFLFPLLTTLRLTRCHDVDGSLIADALMAGPPPLLHQLELGNSDIDPDQYNKVLALLALIDRR
jgi:hypothetical protein